MRDAAGAPATAGAFAKARLTTGACVAAVVLTALPAQSLAQSVAAPPVAQSLAAQSLAAQSQPPKAQPPQAPAPSSAAAGLRGRVDTGPPRLPDRTAHGPIGEDRLAADEMFVEADQITKGDKDNLMIARGHVLARYQDHVLRAEELIYDTHTGKLTANGHAEVANPDGSVEYGEHVVMDDKMHAGVATGFEATMGDAKVAAAAAVRRNEDVNELVRVVYTACGVCTPAGRPTTPTWSIQADDAVQDKAHQVIIYRNATLKVKGVPIFWSPVFWTPDPSNPRESGLLPPRMLSTRRLGFSWEQPYLWVISPSEDLEIRPQVNTSVNPLLNFDWRKRFYSSEGWTEARFGYTFERNFNNEGERYGAETSHSYILANGVYNIDNAWRWGFTAEHSSDPTFFDRYDIQHIFEPRGLYSDDTRRLTSQVYAVRQDTHSFISITALDFESLRIYDELKPNGLPLINPQTDHPFQSAEEQSALPIVAPLIEARWDPDFKILGGRLRAYGSGVLISRSQATLNPYASITPSDPCYAVLNASPNAKCAGVSDQRGSVGAEWRSAYTVNGVRIEPFLNLRGDVYGVQAGYRPFPGLYTLNHYPNFTVERGLSDLGVDISYPLYRPVGAADLIIEPMAELVLSPKAKLDPRIPNEDSQVINFDETTLFRPDRFPGYDLYEGGPRASLGAMATLNWGQGHDARVFLGRAFRSETDLAFPAGTGLQGRSSDWIVFAATSPITGLNAWTRQRFDGQTGALRRSEAALNWNFDRAHGIFRYLMDDTGVLDLIDPSYTYPLSPPGRREEAEAAGYIMATRHWGITYDAIRDLRQDIWRRSEAGIIYRDICIDISLVYQRNETNPLGPSSTVLLRLNFPMTGRLGFLNYDTR